MCLFCNSSFLQMARLFLFLFITTDDGKLLNGPVVELVHLNSTVLVCSTFYNHFLGSCDVFYNINNLFKDFV